MKSISTIKEIREIIKEWKLQGLTVGFVPTMGYLHKGHKSLIEKARKDNDKLVVSIFVNPMQFGPNEDFEKYPRSMKCDLQICNGAGADIIFTPSVTEMNPSKNLIYIDVNELSDNLCGATRPGHFIGVCTIVAKLFNIITPDKAYFGKKDAQQLAIIKRMVQDLNFDMEIIACPIIREADGLAISSRNSFLSLQERKASVIIYQSLELAKDALFKGERDNEAVRKLIINKISSEPLAKVDYINVVDAVTLKPVNSIVAPVLVAVAVHIGKTRLIDNFLFEV